MRISNFQEKKYLGAAHWVGAITRGAEGSYMQLPVLYDIHFRHHFVVKGAISRHRTNVAADVTTDLTTGVTADLTNG